MPGRALGFRRRHASAYLHARHRQNMGVQHMNSSDLGVIALLRDYAYFGGELH